MDLALLVYYEWFSKVTDALGAYLAGGRSWKMHCVIIYDPRKDELIGNNSSELLLETAAT